MDNFQSLFDFLPIGAYRSLPDGRMLRANPALVALNGCNSETELFAMVRDIAAEWYVEPGRRGEFKALLERDGHVIGFESEIYRPKSRERIWVRENAHVLRDANGVVQYYEGTVEEITDRVREREALQRSQAQLEQVVRLVPGVVYRIGIAADGTRRYTYVSDHVRQLYGVTPQQVLADGNTLTNMRHPDDVDEITRRLEQVIAADASLIYQVRVRLRDGTEKWVQAISAAAPAEDGERARVGVLFDITERKQAEALRAERDRATAADIAKSQFLSRVSHELRTPLNAILGFAQLLEMDPGGSARQQGWNQQVLASGRHLLALMDDILDLSSAETGHMTVLQEPVPLRAVVEEAWAMVHSGANDLAVTLVDALPPGQAEQVLADRKRLKQVVSNLLSNAVKYNRPEGWVRVSLQAAGPQWALAVADSGLGLDESQQARLFHAFDRLGAERGPVQGTGLGLALSRQLAQTMGGEITVSSTPGVGSVFTLRLPKA